MSELDPAPASAATATPEVPERVARPRVLTVVLAVIAATLLTVFVATAVLMLLATRSGVSLLDPAALTTFSSSPAVVQWLLVAQSGVLLCVALVVALCSPERAAPRLGLVRPAGARGESFTVARLAAVMIATTVATWSVNCCVMSLALLGSGGERSTLLTAIDDAIRQSEGSDFLVVALGVALLASVSEELFFRGVVQRRLSARFGPILGVGVASSLFALAHFDWMHSSAALAMGLAMGVGAHRSRSTWTGVLAHVTNNAAVVLITRLAVPSPAALSSHAIAAGVYCVLAIGAVAVLVRATR
ncbi:MAG: CPBP family intramembrane metalloprotease [Deltaproteobacteria bacterium]|nr:CPBP family intramembrane metalloprotease [Deltaproteobacteria bacterium]